MLAALSWNLRMRRAAGLTVMELLVALAILAVLAGFGLPAFRASLESTRISTALFAVSAHFASARMTAITTRQVVSLCPTLGADSCLGGSDWSADWLLYRGQRRLPQPADPADVLQRLPRPGHGSIRLNSSAGRRALHFLPDGRAAGSNLRMQLCLEGWLRGEVVVNNTGRVRSRRLPGIQRCNSIGN